MKSKIYITITLLLLTQAILGYFIINQGPNHALTKKFTWSNFLPNNTDKPTELLRSYSMNKNFYDEAYQNLPEPISKTEVSSGIIPHHLFVKEKIASYFENLKNNNYDTVVLIGPDHFNAAPASITLSNADWDTPFGRIQHEATLYNNLSRQGLPTANNIFASEHSLSGLIPFIKQSLPQAKLLPIIISPKTEQEDLDKLSFSLALQSQTQKTLVLASVDFSHYLPTDVADFHDDYSQLVIESALLDQVDMLEVDSPNSLYALLKYNKIIGHEQADLFAHTNSGVLSGQPDEPTTSHNFYYFTAGEPRGKKALSLLFFGDLMLDRHVKEVINDKGLDYIIESLAAEELRFFSGQDIISANLEGSVTFEGNHYSPQNIYDFAFDPADIQRLKKYNFNFFNLANNHITDQGQKGFTETEQNLQNLNINYSGCPDKTVAPDCTSTTIEINGVKLGLAGFSMVYGKFDEDKAKVEIENLKSRSDLAIVNIHWGVEYAHNQNQTQIKLAHELIDAGADIIIGHHPHVVQGMEFYQNKPIFYSLGNFIFDQYFSRDTEQGLAVGLIYDGANLKYSLFPFEQNNKKLQLLTGKNKNSFLQNFQAWSPDYNLTENFNF